MASLMVGLNASLETTYIATLSVGIVLASIALALRLYTRLAIEKQSALDDWLLVPAQILNVASAVIWMVITEQQRDVCYAAPSGSNRRCAMVLSTCIYAKLCLKCALALFLVKMVRKTWQRWTVYAVLAAYAALIVSASVLIFLRCGFDIDSVHLGITKVNEIKKAESTLVLTAGAVNSASNWVFALLAILIISRPKDVDSDALTRTSLWPLIALAVVASILSVYRMPVASKANSIGQYDSAQHDRCMVLSLVETTIGIMALSLTSSHQLFASWRANSTMLFGERSDSDLESATVITSGVSSMVFEKVQPPVPYNAAKNETLVLRRLGILPDVSSESLVLVEEIQACPPPVTWDEAYNKWAMPTITESLDGEDDIK